MDDIWLQTEDGVYVTEISTLDAYKMFINGKVQLPCGILFPLIEARSDRHGGEVQGWRFDYNNRNYLVIND